MAHIKTNLSFKAAATMERFEKLCEECKNKVEPMGCTLLYSAVEANHDMCVQLLVDGGADVNWRNRRALFYTPLIKAAQKGNSKIVGLLLKAGANRHQTDCFRYSPLMFAASNGREECVDLLLKSGADVNTGDKHNYTAVIYASQKGHHRCVELLIVNKSRS